MNGKLVLLVEDNEKVLDFNKYLLEEQGFAVETVMSLASARDFVGAQMPDAIILDIGMPDGSGLDFLREFRKASKTPVLLLTGFGKDNDVIAGFESGCNDYLPKPYTFGVLLARLKNLLRGAEQVPQTLVKDPFRLNMISKEAFLNGADMLLTPTEFSLLLLFVQYQGDVMNTERLYQNVWGHTFHHDTGAVKYHVSRLRKKLKGSGYSILMKRGEGYCLKKD